MKKKLLLFILIFMSFFMFNAKAYALDMKISDVSIIDKSSSVTGDITSHNDNAVDNNIIFSKVDDYVLFNITIKNNEDYKYTIDSIKNVYDNEYIVITSESDKLEIDKNGTFNLKVKAIYNKKLINKLEENIDNVLIKVTLVREDGKKEEIIINPVTGDNLFKYLILLILAISVLILTRLLLIKGKKIYGILMIFLLVISVPFIIFANEKYEYNFYINGIKYSGEFEIYNITFDLDNGNDLIVKQIKYGDSIEEMPSNPTKNGYIFDKWVDESGNKVTKDTIIKKEISVKALYKVVEYNINYDLDGGSLDNGVTNPTKYTIETDTFTLNSPKKSGYTFVGWKENDVIKEVVTIQKGSTGEHNLKAIYEEIDLDFTNQNIELTYSSEEQESNIIAPTNGSGNYTYREISEKNSQNADTDYIRIENNKIIFNGNMPVGGYSFVIEAEDALTGVKEQALYTIIINKKTPILTLDNNEVTVKYNENVVINYSYDGDGEIICENEEEIVLCEVDRDNNKIIITPKIAPKSGTILVKGINGTNYSDITKTISINIIDDDKPNNLNVISTNDLSETQTVTLSCQDEVGITGYYFGTESPSNISDFTEITSTKNMLSAEVIGTEGTYYFACVDQSNNMSDIVTKSFYKTSFVVDHGTITTPKVLTMEGNKYNLPTPTADNKYGMIGNWYTNNEYSEGEKEYGTEYEPTSSSSLYTYAIRNTFTVTYDYLTNGGYDVSTTTRDYKVGKNVSLTVTAESNNEVFIGWNTDKDAKVALTEFIMPNNDVTLYAIFGRAEFMPGEDFQFKMFSIMKLGGGDVSDFCLNDREHYCYLKFNNFTRSTTIPDEFKTDDYIVSSDESEVPIYLWYDTTNHVNTYYWYTVDPMPFLNKNSSWMFSMFEGDPLFSANIDFDIDLSNFDTSKVENMSYMFAGTEIEKLDLSTWDTSSVTNMEKTFLYVRGLTTIYVSDSFVTDNVTNSADMFKNSNDLVGQEGTTYDDNHLDIEYAHVDDGLDNPGYLTKRTHSIFKTGKEVNTFIKKLVNGSNSKFFNFDNHTKYFKRSSTIPDEYKNDNYVVSLKISNYPIYMWFIEDTIYWYSESEKVDFNNDSSFFFSRMWYLEIISDFDQMDTSNVTNMSYMFADCQSLREIDLSSFNTKHVTNMQSMFYDCRALTSIDLSPLDTSKVKYMSDMFADCHNLQSLDLNPLDTNNVINMQSMFAGCHSLSTLDLSPLDTSNVTNMSGMFADCTSLTSLNLSPLNTSKVTTMLGMFAGMTSLTSLDLSPLDTSNVTNMKSMFASSTNLQSIEFGDFDTSNVTDMSGMFYNCKKLKSLDLTGFDTRNVTKMGKHSGSIGCASAYNYLLCDYDLDYYGMFTSCSDLEKIYVSTYFDTTNVTESLSMFSGSLKLVGSEGTTYDKNHTDKEYARIDGGVDNPGYFSIKPAKLTTGPLFHEKLNSLTNNSISNIKEIKFSKTLDIDVTNLDSSSSNVVSSADSESPIYAWYDNEILYLYTEASIIKLNSNSSYLFNGMSGLQEINLSKFDASNITNMSNMFAGCSNLTSLDLSKFETSNVTDMSYIFNGCSSLSYANLSGFDFTKTNHTSIFTGLNISTLILDNAKFQSDMSNEFAGMHNLTTLSLNNVDTSNVTNMASMLSSCTSLTNIDFSSFDTSKVTNMSSMFAGSSKLTELNLSTFNTSKVTYMNAMFGGCTNLKKLDISNFDFTKVGQFGNSFFNNMYGSNLTEMNVKNVIFPEDSSNAFLTLTKLERINLENVDTSNVKNMSNMFNNCSKLEELDLSSFNTTNVLNMENMFNNCTSLKTIYVSNSFVVPNTSMTMFGMSTSVLEGGEGTTLNDIMMNVDTSNWYKSLYARIDGGVDNPGYFTYKEPNVSGSISKFINSFKNSKYSKYILVSLIGLITVLYIIYISKKNKKK
ncbi:MAG: BspA family leucine-rich repeat surface protein [Bacilli bacterium]|nr:BspA family leucine-rich repeat surface protein [Bacilli bacterium]